MNTSSGNLLYCIICFLAYSENRVPELIRDLTVGCEDEFPFASLCSQVMAQQGVLSIYKFVE